MKTQNIQFNRALPSVRRASRVQTVHGVCTAGMGLAWVRVVPKLRAWCTLGAGSTSTVCPAYLACRPYLEARPGRGVAVLGTKAPAKIQEVTLMRPIHGNL